MKELVVKSLEVIPSVVGKEQSTQASSMKNAPPNFNG